jgi:Uma2 family endonuclease
MEMGRQANAHLIRANGSVKKIVAPTLTAPSAQTRPPCRSTTRYTVASPIPVPGKSASLCRRWNGVNNSEATGTALTHTADRPRKRTAGDARRGGRYASRAMPTSAPKRRATYQDVLNAPDEMIAEVLDGELHLMPRPKRRHLRTASGLGAFLFGAFDAGASGPGGWTIIDEPELHLGPEPDILVPDIGGWRDGRLVDEGENDDAFISVVPDWVCEILSPGTERIDRMKKMPIFARERVAHVWLVDPREKTVEVFRIAGATYTLVGTFGGDEAVVAEPFDALGIPLAFLWARKESAAK